ncbi:GDSL-type esterase/lipase family protein [Cellulomonas sp. NPDC058312]|uniref:GDSL-type esterase/lipase family protein n=1 Tax=Cellulomonas sp. NPDC058312 TaxID=3346441 RepID=UPI0036EE0848
MQFVVDVSSSTWWSVGMDCDGDGTSAGDDLNADGRRGDVLDCEIAAVGALNADLRAQPAAATGVRVGLTAFAGTAVVATVDPDPDLGASPYWVTPGATATGPGTGTDVIPRLTTVASSLRVDSVGQYVGARLTGGTSFDAAITRAAEAFGDPAVAGARQVVLVLSDGQGPVSPATLDRVAALGLQVRTFAIGLGSGGCAARSALASLAAAGGDVCTSVSNPAGLRSALTSSTPAAVLGVDVTVGSSTTAATVDALGSWSATVRDVAHGPATATVTARYVDGSTSVQQVPFTVGEVFRYVAMGDSYASGEGVRPYLDQDPTTGTGRTEAFLCHRSARGWPALVRRDGTGDTIADQAADDPDRTAFGLVACSGARMVNLDTVPQLKEGFGKWLTNPPQVQALTPDTDLVTLSIGGNDIGFAPIISHCMQKIACYDDAFVTDALGRDITLRDWSTIRMALVGSELGGIYRDVRNRTGPDTRVIALTYPRLVSGSWAGPVFGNTCLALGPGERGWLRAQADTFADIVHHQARRRHVEVADVRDAFEGHLVCDLDNHVYPVETTRMSDLDQDFGHVVSAASFHPTSQGVAHYARIVNETLAGQGSGADASADVLDPASDAAGARTADPAEPPATEPPGDPRIATDPAAVLARYPQETIDAVAATTFAEVRLGHGPSSPGTPRCDAVVPGERVPYRGEGFAPGSAVTAQVHVDGRVMSTATTTADDDGRVRDELVTPAVDGSPLLSVRFTSTTRTGTAVGYAHAETTDDPACVAPVVGVGRATAGDTTAAPGEHTGNPAPGPAGERSPSQAPATGGSAGADAPTPTGSAAPTPPAPAPAPDATSTGPGHRTGTGGPGPGAAPDPLATTATTRTSPLGAAGAATLLAGAAALALVAWRRRRA